MIFKFTWHNRQLSVNFTANKAANNAKQSAETAFKQFHIFGNISTFHYVANILHNKNIYPLTPEVYKWKRKD